MNYGYKVCSTECDMDTVGVQVFRVGAWQLCHPLSWHCDGSDKTPVCPRHSPSEQRHSSATETKTGRTELPPRSEHLTSVCWYQMWWSSSEPREVCCGWKHDRDTDQERQREREESQMGCEYLNTQILVTTMSCGSDLIFVFAHRLSALCPASSSDWWTTPFDTLKGNLKP